MRKKDRTFAPASRNIFWCPSCNVPLLSERCSACKGYGDKIDLSPPADIRLCSTAGLALLKELFSRIYGYSEFLDGRIVLLNKIAGLDRRDQVYFDGHHIATLWFDITDETYHLDLELAGALLIADSAGKNVVAGKVGRIKGHLKGKWLEGDQIEGDLRDLREGDCVILKIGKNRGVGVVRRRSLDATAIRVKDVSREGLQPHRRRSTINDAVNANIDALLKLESTAIKELKETISQTNLPVNISFSGGKDSLAALSLGLKVRPKAEVLFIDTKLEYPETVDYVHSFCASRNLKLHIIEVEDNFFEQVQSFGPPAKDFRWCCKTNKLGPLTSFIQQRYPHGCLTIEGRRIFESFSRSRIGAVERNPFVPHQTTLNPIRNWRALEVMMYLHMNKLTPHPLYDQDYERIGCWLCPASLQSEYANLKKTHPQLYQQWTTFLNRWAEEKELDPRYVSWGFWRWRSHPPKIREIAQSQNIDLKIKRSENQEINLEVVKGRSPCGMKYSIEGTLTAPSNHPFRLVANALSMLGHVKYSESLDVAVLEMKESKCTIFANGHLFLEAPQKRAEGTLKKVVETVLRVQTCTGCKICEKSCKQKAITVKETIIVDLKLCNRCQRCFKGCIASSQASKIISKLKI